MPNLNLASAPDTAIKSPMPAFGTNRTLWHRLKGLAIVLVILALAASNVMTLASDHFHAKAYGVLKAFVSLPVVDTLAKAFFPAFILISSPTEKTAAKIEAATRPLAVATRDLIEATRHLLDEDKKLAAANRSERNLLLKNHLDEQNRLVKTHSDEREKLLETTERHRAATKRLAARIVPRMTKNAVRNVSSIMLEALPYAGIPVMIAVTTADVLDACETLKDLNLMNEAFGEAKQDESKVCGMQIPSAKEIFYKIRRH